MAGRLRTRERIYLYGLYAWGDGTDGSMGDGNVTSKSSPVQIGSAKLWVPLTGGVAHRLALVSGKLFTWGRSSDYGQLGHGDRTNRSSPVQVGSAADWTYAAAGNNSNHIGAIRGGRLFTWGHNINGQLGLGNTTSRSSPVQVGSETDWTWFFGGGVASFMIRGGKVFACGYNANGQLGLGDTGQRNSPSQIGAATDWLKVFSGGYLHTHGMRGTGDAGTLYSWGTNVYGELGDGSRTNRNSPVVIGAATDWSWIAAGANHTLGLRNGALFAWGLNSHGQLGLSDVASRSSPVQVGSETDWTEIACADMSSYGIRNGRLFSWGYNADGELGDGTITKRSSPVQVGSFTNWKSVAGGGSTNISTVHASRW